MSDPRQSPYGQCVSAGFIYGADRFRPFNNNGDVGGAFTRKVIDTWSSDDGPVPWSLQLRGRQLDTYDSATRVLDHEAFVLGRTPAPGPAYFGSTVQVRITWDDDESIWGTRYIECDVGTHQQIIVPPTRRFKVEAIVAADFQSDGTFPSPGEDPEVLRELEVVAYARPTFEDHTPDVLRAGGPQMARPITLSEILQLDTATVPFLRSIPPGAYAVQVTARNATIGGSGTCQTMFDWNRVAQTTLISNFKSFASGGPVELVPFGAAAVRSVNPDPVINVYASYVWRIQP